MLVGGVGTVLNYYMDAYPVVRKNLPADKYMCIRGNSYDISN